MNIRSYVAYGIVVKEVRVYMCIVQELREHKTWFKHRRSESKCPVCSVQEVREYINLAQTLNGRLYTACSTSDRGEPSKSIV